MPATVNIEQWTGPAVSIVKTAITNGGTVNSGASDSPTPVPVPQDQTISGGVSRQTYVQRMTLNCSVGPAGILNNTRYWCSTTLPANWVSTYSSSYNIQCLIYPFGTSGGYYQQATGTPNVTGTFLASLYGVSPVSIFTYTSGSPLAVGGSLLAASAPSDTWGGTIVYQFTVPPKWVNTGVSTGIANSNPSPVVFNLAYDEV